MIASCGVWLRIGPLIAGIVSWFDLLQFAEKHIGRSDVPQGRVAAMGDRPPRRHGLVSRVGA
jgi:hypothetical protein